MQSLELKIPPVLVVFTMAFAMKGLALLAPGLNFMVPGAPYWAGGLVVASLLLLLLSAREFSKADTKLDPRNPDDSSALVTGGVYRFSRNPIYLGFLLLLIAAAIDFSNALAFTVPPLFVVYMNRFQIAPEERYMREKFGEQFRNYTRRVRRWV